MTASASLGGGMRLHSFRGGRFCLLATLLLSPAAGLAVESAGISATTGAVILAQAAPASMAEYQYLLAQYLAARQRYEAEADAYWSVVADRRRLRVGKRRGGQDVLLQDYVLSQPPLYAGPPPPIDPSAPSEEPPRKYVPVVADLLRAAAQEFKFVPQPPRSEIEYKRAYAKVAAAAGLTREQAVRIYAFESSGNGKYDVQAGLEYPRPVARAISTVLGYNQLLSTNSIELLAEKGHQFTSTLQARATGLSGDAKEALQRKLAVLKSMIAFSRSVPDTWNDPDGLANTQKGAGIHIRYFDCD